MTKYKKKRQIKIMKKNITNKRMVKKKNMVLKKIKKINNYKWKKA